MEWLDETAAQKHCQGRPAIFPGLELLFFAGMIANRHLKNAVASSQNAGRNLRLNLETTTLHRQGPCDLSWYQFIAGFHIMNMATIQDIRHRGQETIAPPCGKLL